jgi:protein O-mannosyl-transferase
MTAAVRLPLLLALVTVAVYLPALGASFQFDDWSVIVGDPRVASLAAWWESMPGIRPLLKLSYALNHAAGSGPAGFRLVNILLHAGNVVLLHELLRRVLREGRLADEVGARTAAAIAAVVFALHPVQTECVTYVSGRSTLLATGFALAALLAARQRAPGGDPWRGRFIALPLLAAAIAAKETAAVTPLAMLLLAQVERPHALRANLLAVLPSVLLVAALLALGLAATRYGELLAVSLATRGPLANLALQIDGVWYLLGQLLRWDRLNVDPALPAYTGLQWFLHALLLKGLLVTGLASLRRQRLLALALLWTCIWLLPTNSFIARLDVVNDRQLYLAIAGPALLLATGLLWLRRRLPQAANGIVLALALAMMLGTAVRNRVYADETTLWRDVTAKSPGNARAWNNLGMAEAVACHPDAAREAFEHARQLSSDDLRAEINLALLDRGELPGVGAACAE